MIIFVEGNKCTFKSTICKMLLETFSGFELFKGIVKGEKSLLHNHESYEHARKYLLDFWDELLNIAKTKNMILDRNFITNYTYTSSFPDANRTFLPLNVCDILTIQNKILEMNLDYTFIYLEDTTDSLWRRYTKRGTHEVVTTDFIKTYQEMDMLNIKYNKAMCRIILDVFTINCQDLLNNKDLVFNCLKEYIEKRF